MASVRDLLVGAVLSGAMTFGTTYYFNERNRALDAAALAQAQAASEAAERLAGLQRSTVDYFTRWQSSEYAAARDTLLAAVQSRPNVNINAWDAGPGASAANSDSMRTILRFYSDLGNALDAEQVDADLTARLFAPNVLWWNERVLPNLCRGYIGGNDRFDSALDTFNRILPSGETGCPHQPMSDIGRPMPQRPAIVRPRPMRPASPAQPP